MIIFRCRNCGQRFKVPAATAGKKGRCPKCKETIRVPRPAGSDAARNHSEQSKAPPAGPEIELMPPPPADRAADAMPPGEQFALIAGRQTDGPEPPPRRRLPWIIDIFFYPVNRPGLLLLTICVGAPLIANLIVKLLAIWTLVFTPMFVFLMIFWIVRLTLEVLLTLYVLWYWFECIKDSADGGIRAPETVSNTPGLVELFWQLLRTFICVLLFTAPCVLYVRRTQSVDAIFWLLYTSSLFFFPMAFLGIAMFDSFRALNPVLLVGSVRSSLFHYFALVLFLGAPSWLVIALLQFVPDEFTAFLHGLYDSLGWSLWHIAKLVLFYTAMVTGHLLGRFYWKCQEKLDWDV
ncbi:MAG: hypothetical protein JSU94_10830 [Phycisphaerales bacterium]|nr:MAG: hypothetical protein JSU94_10830 [Phycisphaerales bacterium]